MEVPTSVAIMQVLKFYCSYVGGTFCTLTLVDLFVAMMQVTVSVAVYIETFLQHLCR